MSGAAGQGYESSDVDPFVEAYLAGVPSALADRGLSGVDPSLVGAAGPAEEIRSRVMPAETTALGGEILTADGAVHGWLTVDGGEIVAISPHRPEGARTLETDGVILPGLIDLHGHPEFNVFAPWEPPRPFVNRYAWRGSPEYKALIREPQNRLLTGLPPGTQLRYAETRALVGGVTAIQGASARTQGTTESLVRNVDGVIFGEHRARSLIDLPATAESAGALADILEGISRQEVTAFYLHLAEGRRDDQPSIDEFGRLTQLDGLTSATVLIHGSALTREQLGAAADSGAKLVWSPQSNLRLYGETTRAADALDVGLAVALGADWLPSGSTSLLAEMKVARRLLAQQGLHIEARDLVAMVTSRAAEVAGLDDRLGTLQSGRAADVLVLARRDDDLYESVCAATPDDVELVLIGGSLVYGRTDWVEALAAEPHDPRLEQVLAWGRPMLLDTSYEGGIPDDGATPRLEDLRRALTEQYPPVGPIWA